GHRFRRRQQWLRVGHSVAPRSDQLPPPRRCPELGSDAVNDRFVAQRRALIEKMQEKGIRNLEVLRAFDMVPRHLFLPESVVPRAYEDAAVPTGFGQTPSQASLQA